MAMHSLPMLTIAEAATYLGVNPKTVRRYIADGTLVGYRLGGRRLIRLDRAGDPRIRRGLVPALPERAADHRRGTS